MIRHAVLLAALSAAGCGDKTGFLLDVTLPPGSTQKSITSLELVMAQRSWCDRWVEDKGVSHTKVNVAGRDLATNPYTFLVEPVQATDIKAHVVPLVLARGANDQLLGFAGFGGISWAVNEVRRYREFVQFLQRGPDGPQYLPSDGCVCLPGQVWMGNGSQTGCDLDVITPFARLQDTKQCELPPGSQALPQACDGQQYPGEAIDRELPCFAVANNACRVGTRNCHDDSGFAYDGECLPDGAAPSLPDNTLCDAYLGCERNACGDIIGCFTQALTPERHTCTMRIALTNDGAMHPCTDGDWVTTLSTATDACPATMVEGTAHAPFTAGFRVPNTTGAQVVGTCPLTFGVDSVDASSYDDVPYFFELWATIKNKLIRVHVDIVIGCKDGVPSLVCQ